MEFIKRMLPILQNEPEYIEEIFKNSTEETKFNILLLAVNNNLVDAVKEILRLNQVDVTLFNNRAFLTAVTLDNPKIVSLLLENGADVHARNDEALKRAIKQDNKENIYILIKNGADIHVDDDKILKELFFAGEYAKIQYLIDNNYVQYDYVKKLFPFINSFKKPRESFGEKFTLVDVIDFLNILQEEKIQFSVCDINEKNYIVKAIDTKLLEKNSASQSDSVFTTLVVESGLENAMLPVALKIFINNEFTQGLLYEAKLYREILKNIVAYNLSPNFVNYVGFSECASSALKDYGKEFEAFSLYETHVCILITERVGNGTMFGYNKNLLPVYTLKYVYSILSDDEFEPVMLQICYSLHLMQQFKIVHNDLHSRNVLVMELPEPVKMLFTINDKMYLVNTKYIPYLFDWDFGYMEELGVNKHTIKFPYINNKFSKKADLYTLLCTLKTEEYKSLKGFTKEFPSIKAKEERVDLEATPEQIIKIHQYREHAKDSNVNIYKFSKAQFDEIFPGILSDELVHVFVEVHNYHKVRMYNGFGCRQTTTSKGFPTPLEYIEKYLGYYEVTENDIDETINYSYSIPKSKELTLYRESLEK